MTRKELNGRAKLNDENDMPQVIMIAEMDGIVCCDASNGQEMVRTLEMSIDRH